MSVTFEMAAIFHKPGDFSGEIHFTNKDGEGVFAVCPVYFRVIGNSAGTCPQFSALLSPLCALVCLLTQAEFLGHVSLYRDHQHCTHRI